MINLEKITDPYERRARLYPSLLCFIPLIIAVSLSFPSLYKELSGLVALAVSLGSLQLLANLARDRGKRLEFSLFEEWGGIPSVTIFRYSDNSIPAPAKRRYHEILSKRSGIAAPPQKLEAESPKDADEIYRSWSDYLRGQTRDTAKYQLLFKENINYGFRRNLLGIKYFCIVSGIIALFVIGVPAYIAKTYTSVQVGIALLVLLYVFVLLFVVNKDWVKITAFAYAKQLIESVNA